MANVGVAAANSTLRNTVDFEIHFSSTDTTAHGLSWTMVSSLCTGHANLSYAVDLQTMQCFWLGQCKPWVATRPLCRALQDTQSMPIIILTAPACLAPFSVAKGE